MDSDNIDNVNRSIQELWPHLNEKQRRLLAASQAKSLGHGSITFISELCGLSRVTITAGMKELDDPPLYRWQD
jgi:hypothetical protein